VEPVVSEVVRGITAIDTFFGGRRRATAACLLDATSGDRRDRTGDVVRTPSWPV
jgi:hypothetical protein